MPTATSVLPYVAAAVFSGVSFAMIPILYRMGQARGLSTINVFSIGATGGLLFFLCKFVATHGGPVTDLPGSVWFTGLAVGFGQYFAIKSAQIAISRGPLTPVWCAATLGFVPAVAYSSIVCGERVGPIEWAGILVGLGAVGAAAVQRRSPGDGGPAPRPAAPHEAPPSAARRAARLAAYGGLLVVMMVSNGLPMMGIKELGRHWGTRLPPAGHLDFMWVLVYGMLAATLWLDLIVTGRLRVAARPVAVLGLLSAAGSIGGIWALGVSGQHLSGATAFTVMCCVQILGTAVFSVLFFREVRTRIWYATLGFSMLAVVLLNIQSVAAAWQGGP